MLTTAYFLTGPGQIEPVTFHLDDLASGWARVRFLYCGLCGSDVSMFQGRHGLQYPRSIGHEFLGVVEEVGNAVSHLAAGDTVTSDLNYRCGTCDQCRSRRSHLCHKGQDGLFTNRAFAVRADFHARYLLPLAGDLSPHMCLTEPLSCVLHARNGVSPTPQDRVLVVGAGGIGVCMAFALSTSDPALPFEITEAIPARLAAIRAVVSPLGAAAVATPAGEYDVVFDVSGTALGLNTACRHVKPGGRLCSMSHLPEGTPADFLLDLLTRRDVTFRISYLNGERENLVRAAALLQRRWTLAWDSLLDIVPLARLEPTIRARPTSPLCKTILDIGAPEQI